MMKLLRHGAFALASVGPALCVAQVDRAAAEAAHVSPATAGVQASPHLAAISTPPFQAHAATISTVKQQTLTSKEVSRFSAPQQAQFHHSVERLAEANKAFSDTEQTMRPKQRLLADVQVDLAASALRRTVGPRTAAVETGAPRPDLLQASVSLSAGAETAAQAISMPPLDVLVYVQSSDGKPAEPMDVYVLPIGVVEYGRTLEITKIRNVFDGLTFKNPTSPASGDLEPGYVYAVWIGSRNAAQAMAQLVQDGMVRYHTIDTSLFHGPFSITFDASERVVAR